MSSAGKKAGAWAKWDGREVASPGNVASAEDAGSRGGEAVQAGVTEDPSAIGDCTLSSIRDEINMLRREIATRDVLLQKLEENVTRLTEDLTPLKEYVKMKMQEEMGEESLRARASSESSPLVGILETEEPEEIIRYRCIKVMMSLTEILGSTEEKICKVSGFYEKIYDTAHQTSLILMVLEKHRNVKIFIDCDHKHIGRLVESGVDLDGNTKPGKEFKAFADLVGGKIYAAGKSSSSSAADLAECLMQFAMHVIFGNMGCPYACGDLLTACVYEKVAFEVRHSQNIIVRLYVRGGQLKTHVGREVLMISAIPGVLVEKGLKEGMPLFDFKLSSLLKFCNRHVFPKMVDYLRE